MEWEFELLCEIVYTFYDELGRGESEEEVLKFCPIAFFAQV